jgi:hypothetical protein
MSTFFVVHTPYHILLSCGIASLESNEKKYLIIIVEDIDKISKYKQIISSSDKKLFSEIFILNSLLHVRKTQDETHKKLILLIDLLNKLKINLLTNLPLNKLKMKSILKKNTISEGLKTYIFADINVNAQYFAKICSEHNGTIIYVEDGAAVYTNYTEKVSKFKKIMCKVIYGFWYTHLELQGTSKYIDTLMVAYPEFLHPELKRKKHVQIPEKAYTFLNDYLSPYLNETFEINTENLNYIIILPYSPSLKDKDETGIINMYKSIIENLIVNNKVGLKYHPREKANYLNLKFNPNLSLIPKSIPLEIIWMASKGDKLKAVIGDTSTALITSKKMLRFDTKVISLGKLMNLNEKFYTYLGKFGILIPESFEGLMSHLIK